MNATRTVPLADDQYIRLSATFEKAAALNDMLSAILLDAAETLAKEREDAWQCVERLAGTTRGENQLSIDWINRCIVVATHQEEPTK